MRKSWKRFAFLVVPVLALVPLLVACETNAATSLASCGFVVGDGSTNHDAKLHEVIRPGEKTNVGDSENISFVPCNPRNYLINNGEVYNANGEKLGDRHQPIQATTNTGVPLKISVSAYWTLNQSDKAMRDFYTVCFKYKCSGKDTGGEANFSTPGWNGMLGENFGPALETVGKAAAFKVDNSIWELQDPTQYKMLGDEMSAGFADAIRARFGYQEDLFCGSGNSAWKNPDNPGDGEFTCSPVRIVIDDVQVDETKAEQNTAGAEAMNAQRLKNAQAIYGPEAGYWLAMQDAIEKCKSSGPTCIVNIGGTNAPVAPAVSVPIATPR